MSRKPFPTSAGTILRRTPIAATVAALCAFGATPAFSQESASADEGLEEIIVTAQFRQERLQDTPIAITAVTGDMLEARSQTSIFQVAAQAPNVSLNPQGQYNGSGIVAFIRGVGQTDFNYALEPGVGIYVDDVYYSTLTGSLLDLLDLDRVEVLRGPQGTLAGRNSIGGAIKLFSKKASGDGGYVSLATGSYNRLEARGSADFELSKDKLYARISAVSKSRDGYVERVDYACSHPGSGLPTLKLSDGCSLGTLGGTSYIAGRVSLRWIASDDLEVNIIGDMTQDKSEAGADVLRYANRPSVTLNGVPLDCRFVPYGPDSCDPKGGNPYLSYATFVDMTPATPQSPFKPVVVPPIQHLNSSGLSATVDWKLSDTLSVKSISAYRQYDSSWAQDVDGTPLAAQQLLQTLHHEQVTQELRLNGSNLGGALDWTLGGFYFDQDGTLEARVDLPYAGLDFIHGPDPTPSTSWALFAHASYHFTDATNLSVGLRRSEDKKSYTYYRRNPNLTVPGPCATLPPAAPTNSPNCALNGLYNISDTFQGDRIDWRVALDHKWTDDFMTYVQVSTGYKSGGVNPRPFFGPGTPAINQLKAFKPEELTTYELGFKSDLLGDTLRLNGAVFFNNYKDIILSLSACPIAPCAQPNNVGEADVKGAELEATVRLGGGWSADISASVLDFEYKKTDQAKTNVSLSMITPYTPEKKISAGIQYRQDLNSGGSLTARVDTAYQSDMYAQPINAPSNYIPGYTVSNARLTWRDAAESWDVSLEVLNLADKLYYYGAGDWKASSGTVSYTPAPPRTWGVSVKRNF